MTNVIDVLKERGFIEALTSEELHILTEKPMKVYCGFDPTGDSLHLGNMVPMMGLAWFQRFGHTPYAIVGGATGMVGDPSGKSSERQLLDEQTLQKNLNGIRQNLEAFLDFNHPSTKPVVLNNFDWFKNFSFIDFLRDVGKYFRIGPMLAKDSVKARMATEEGMSFTEFSYQLLQGYDFLYLNQNHGVDIQLGGSDQWGNITAGIDLVRKVNGKGVFGLTFPLLTRSDGQKFGKSEKGAIWLSPEKVSPYEFYQYLYRVSDEDVIKLMRMLTFMDMAEIHAYEKMMKKPDYAPNTAQKRLAEEVTRIVHGDKGVETALKVTQGMAPGSASSLDVHSLEALAAQMPNHTYPSTGIVGVKLYDLIAKAGQVSKSEAKRLIRNEAISINNIKIADEEYIVESDQLIEGRLLLLAMGKKNKILIRASI